jgi:two-component system, OmpR family, alkaline phosphatase synthesis response regulator PhoP
LKLEIKLKKLTTKSSYKILVVDDEEDICEIIKFNLESEGYYVTSALSAEAALHLSLEKYHLFILDIMMQGMSGFKLADEIKKKRKIDTPIIFLTAKNTENDKITGFSLGADDYITKPFSVRELIARVNAVLKRSNPQQEAKDAIIKLADIELDVEKRKLYIAGLKVDLTPHEYYIMQLFLKNSGKVFSRNDILNYAWKENNYVVDRTIDVHIAHLRKKLGKYGKNIVSRSGHGYCFELE